MLWLLLRRGAGIGTLIAVLALTFIRFGNALSRYTPDANTSAVLQVTPRPTANAFLTRSAELSATLNAPPAATATNTPRPTNTATRTPTPSPTPAPTPTFVSVEALIAIAHAVTPLPTPVKPIVERTYPNTIWRLLERHKSQYDNLMAASGQALDAGLMYPEEFNKRMSDVAYQAEQVHAIANEVRSLHAPDNYARYHARILAALDVIEAHVLAMALVTDDPNALTDEEIAQLDALIESAADTLTSFPRTGK